LNRPHYRQNENIKNSNHKTNHKFRKTNSDGQMDSTYGPYKQLIFWNMTHAKKNAPITDLPPTDSCIVVGTDNHCHMEKIIWKSCVHGSTFPSGLEKSSLLMQFFVCSFI
jgi:hypothetical protein